MKAVALPQGAQAQQPRPEALRLRKSLTPWCLPVNSFDTIPVKGRVMANLTLVVRELQKQRSQLQSRINSLDTAISTLSSLDGGSRRGGRRSLSAAARNRIAAAQKARWAKWKKANKAA